MSLIDIDTSNEELLKKPVYEPAPASIYQFAVANKTLKVEKSKSSENMMVVVELRCIDDIPYGNGKNTKGLKIKEYMVLTDEGKWKLAQFAKACGIESVDGKLDLDDFIGAECSASIKIEAYKKEETVDGVLQEVTKYSNRLDEFVWE